MKKIELKSFSRKLLAGVLCAVMIFTGPSPASFANETIQGLGDFFSKQLDGIEKLVIDSGLPKAKWDTYKNTGLLIKPFFKTRYDLTSNVFTAPDTNSDHTDNVFSFTPGFQAIYKNKWGVVGMAYEAMFRYYAQFSEQNTQDQKFLVFANLFPVENTYVRVSNRLEQQGPAAGNSAFEPVDIRDNKVNVVAGYVSGDWTYEIGYKNNDRKFQSQIAKIYSFNEDVYDFRLYRKLDENIRTWSGLRLGQVDFYKNRSRDTFYFEIPVGIEAKIWWGINLNASVGLHHRNLENAGRNDITHVVTNISLQKEFNDGKTSVDGGFLRRDVESSFSTATTYDEKLWYVNAKHLVTPKIRARMGLYVANRDFEERVFTGTRIVVLGRVFVTPPTQVKRDDNVFGFNMGFDFNVRKWLIFHLDYQYNRRNSNISSLDYTENVLSLGSTIPL